jgi:conjugative transposon TraJ protein
VFFEAASLCINTIRTFYLIVLAILGPLVFGIAVFDGFQHTLTVWIARYINIFLWLPVSNIFGSIIGKIQENMLKVDIAQVQNYGDTFFFSNRHGVFNLYDYWYRWIFHGTKCSQLYCSCWWW